MSSVVESLKAREILDSRGRPTLEVEMVTQKGNRVIAAVPSGASTGAHEAVELRDKDPKRYLGLGVTKAIENVNKVLAPLVVNQSLEDQKKIDEILLNRDGSKNKGELGANAILGVSLACAKAFAADQGKELYETVGGGAGVTLPVPLMNIINGGAHANNGLDVQEFMIAPVCGGSFKEALRAGVEVFQHLRKILDEKSFSTAVGDEGGFAPKLNGNRQALELILSAIEKAGYKAGEDIYLALDVAATELYKEGAYTWEGKSLSAEKLSELYKEWQGSFPIVSIEDGLSEDDWEGWAFQTQLLGKQMQLVGDDLFVTNKERLKVGIDKQIANSILIKVNQIGSLTETAETIQLAQSNNYSCVMSHRSGETEDTTIADLAVAFNCGQIKTGSLCRSERTAKYNQLLRIEERLGSKAKFLGKKTYPFL
ncbi:MAG TPA: phosphopyruvate hydratase [Bdellovibrionales bacterium]|nr:phosphopyruvate hydratase [Thioclava sp.]HAG91930.1 phosphopyruvate hydratase [Bdellovibrionales bacterium]|tara:strand:+ start:26146 stop:27423 length:1278 start_codon:yes stop_codon:yes gene_type:complete